MVLAGVEIILPASVRPLFAGKGGKFLPEFIVCGACHLGAFGVCGLQTIQQHINIPAGQAGIGILGLGQHHLAVGFSSNKGERVVALAGWPRAAQS